MYCSLNKQQQASYDLHDRLDAIFQLDGSDATRDRNRSL